MHALIVLSTLIALLGPKPAEISGTFAMSGTPSTHGHLVATQGPSPLQQRFDLWLTRGPATTVGRYDIDMTKYLHLVAIGDDFTTFMHIHPALGADHHFRIDARFPKAELYHIYADADPTGIGRQVFRFDLRVGPRTVVSRNLAATGSTVRSGRYVVSLATTQLRAGHESEVAVHVTKDAKPAGDLRPYLGALAHAVFIDAEDLSYAHVHPMALDRQSSMASMPGMSGMNGMSGISDMSHTNAAPLPDWKPSSPDMLLHVVVPETGTYKLWLQFRAADGLHVAPFVVTAS